MHNGDGLAAATTDRGVLAGDAYADDRHLAARQALYVFQQPHHDLPALVTAHLRDGRGLVVDVGCGNGRYVRHLREHRPDLTVVGLDGSTGILADIEAPVLVADAARLPIRAASVDAVLAMHMIYHLADVDAGVREFARVLRPDGLLVASTNARDDKAELDRLWSAAAADVLGVAEGPRVSLSDRFPLDDAPSYLRRHFSSVEGIELPGTITVTEPDPVIAHLASYRSWPTQAGVPFDATLQRARERLAAIIRREGTFRITCRGGVLVARGPHAG